MMQESEKEALSTLGTEGFPTGIALLMQGICPFLPKELQHNLLCVISSFQEKRD